MADVAGPAAPVEGREAAPPSQSIPAAAGSLAAVGLAMIGQDDRLRAQSATYRIRTGPADDRARSMASTRPSKGTVSPISGVGSRLPSTTRSRV